jgi:hypothetical protein
VAAFLNCQVIKDRMHAFIRDFSKMKKHSEKYIIPGKAECISMCPDEEIYTRGEVEFSSVNKFEKDSQGQLFKELAIKSYQRSAADKVMNEK